MCNLGMDICTAYLHAATNEHDCKLCSDYIDNGIVTTPNARADTSAPVEPAVSSANRYPRQEHRAPSRFNDYVPLNYVSDETSA